MSVAEIVSVMTEVISIIGIELRLSSHKGDNKDSTNDLSRKLFLP